MTIVRATVLVAGVLAGGTAAAQPPGTPTPYRSVYAPDYTAAPALPAAGDDTPFVFVTGQLGLNLPIGGAGMELGVGLDWFRGSISTGIGFRGVGVAAMVRAMHDFAGIDLGAGAGISRGPGLHTLDVSLGEGGETSTYATHYASGTLWSDFEFTAEVQLGGNAFTRVALGLTRAMYVECESEHADTGQIMDCDNLQVGDLENDGFLPYLGVAAGFRFPAAPASKPRYAIPQALPMAPFGFPSY